MNSIHQNKGLPGLKKIREEVGLSQSQLASSVGCTAKWVYMIENGTDCTMETQRKFAEALHCDVADLLSEPSERRLLEINVAFLQAEVDRKQRQLRGGAA